MKMYVFYAVSALVIGSVGLFGNSLNDFASFLVGLLFGGLNFLLTFKLSQLILFKKGVANPRLLIVIKLLFLLTGIGIITVLFRGSIAWVSGGFLAFIVLLVFYFLLAHADKKSIFDKQ